MKNNNWLCNLNSTKTQWLLRISADRKMFSVFSVIKGFLSICSQINRKPEALLSSEINTTVMQHLKLGSKNLCHLIGSSIWEVNRHFVLPLENETDKTICNEYFLPIAIKIKNYKTNLEHYRGKKKYLFLWYNTEKVLERVE